MDVNGIFIYRIKLSQSEDLVHNLHNQLCSELVRCFFQHLGPFSHSCIKETATENGD